MPSIDVTGASSRLLAYNPTAAAAQCLRYNWLAVGQGRHYITGGGDTAFNTWRAIPANKRHVGDKHAPEGFQYYLGIRTSTGNALGDVVTADGTFTAFGDPYVIATDWPSAKKVGRCTLSQRIAQTGRQFLGWAESMGGWDLIRPGTAGGGTIIPDPPKKVLDMPLQISVDDSTLKYGPTRKTYFALVGGLLWDPYTDTTRANRIAAYLEKPVAFACTYDEWEAYMRDSGGTDPIAYTSPAAAGGGSVDLGPVIAALTVLHEQIAALPVPPTELTITGKAQA